MGKLLMRAVEKMMGFEDLDGFEYTIGTIILITLTAGTAFLALLLVCITGWIGVAIIAAITYLFHDLRKELNRR